MVEFWLVIIQSLWIFGLTGYCIYLLYSRFENQRKNIECKNKLIELNNRQNEYIEMQDAIINQLLNKRGKNG